MTSQLNIKSHNRATSGRRTQREVNTQMCESALPSAGFVCWKDGFAREPEVRVNACKKVNVVTCLLSTVTFYTY